MESLYQNSVSEFDLNFFEPTTNATTPSAQCHESRKLGIARLKDRLKGVRRLSCIQQERSSGGGPAETLVSLKYPAYYNSKLLHKVANIQVVHKAKKTNEILLEVQKELLVAKQELEETRNLLFEKNEEHKVICDERSVYFEQASEYCNEIQNLKERLAKYEQMDYDTEMKEKVISGYSEQVKGLQLELENLEEEKKQCSRESGMALKNAKLNKIHIENQLVKLLKHYVLPTTKKRNRWLTSVIKQYVPEVIKEEGNGKITKEEKIEETDLDDDLPLAPALTQRNASTDLDGVESVDTGRGSSLEYSDGEKSFHSPEYYMENSPHSTVTNVCKKCNVPKCDVATSPMPEELNVSLNSVAKMTCKKCVSLSRIDSCTSPIPSLMCDETTKNSFEITLRDKIDHNVTQNACFDNVGVNSCTQEIETLSRTSPCRNINNVTKKETVVMFAFDSDEDDDMVDDDSGPFSPDEESNTRISASPVDFDEVNNGDKNIPSKNTPTKILNNDKHDEIETNNDALSIENSPVTESNVGALEERPTQIKIQITVASDNEDDGSIDIYVNRTPSPVHRSSIFTPILDEYASNCSISSLPCATDNNVCGISTDSKQVLNKSKVKELLDINSSNDLRVDVQNDIEIQSILCKMRLHHELITPIPKTPPRRSAQSPNITREAPNTITPQIQKTSETINEQIDSLRTQMQAVFNPFKDIFPQCIEQIPKLFCSSQENEELLRNLLFGQNKKKLDNKCSSTHEKTWNNNHRQPDIVNLNSGSMLTISNEDCAHGSEELTVMEKDINVEENVEEPTNSQNNTPHNKKTYKEKSPAVRINNETNAPLPKVGHRDSNEPITHKSTHLLFGCEDESETDAVIQSNEDTATTIDSKNSLVYESATDSDDDPLKINESSQNLNENSDQAAKKKKAKARKLTKLDKLRNKLVPKGKIKGEVPKSVKKPRFKPIPITPPAPKKTVSASDTAASLNDKTVYENAVKVLAAQKTRNEPRIVIEDCIRYPPDKSDDNENTDDKNNNDKPGKKRKLSESETNSKPLNSDLSSISSDSVTTTEKKKSTHIDDNHDELPIEVMRKSNNVTVTSHNALESDSNLKSSVLDTKKERRKTSCEDENPHKTPEKNRRKSNTALTISDTDDCVNTSKRLKLNSTKLENIKFEKCVTSPNGNEHETFKKPDLENTGTKYTKDVEQSTDKCDAIEPKRKRTSSIITSPIPKRRNSNNVELDSPRILRSSLSNKKKDAEQKNPVVSGGRELRSKVQSQPEKKDNPHLLPTGRRQRISRVKANTQQDSDSAISDRKEDKFEDRVEKEASEITQISCPSNSPKDIIVPEMTNDGIVSYADLNFLMEQDNDTPEPPRIQDNTTNNVVGRKDSLLCSAIEKYGVKTLKFTAKTVSESKIKNLCNKLEARLSEIVELSHEECKDAMRKLVADIRTWDEKMFLRAFIKYLRHPERKIELFSKTVCPPAPPMTKKEQVLLYVIDELQKSSDYRNVVSKILVNIEYALFALNKTAEEFDVIESMAHFYALLCRSYQKLSKLRLFIVDAMYCLQMKAVILVQQCLEVWMIVLPLGHMGIAKCPLVTCLVYLLHFFKCDDKFGRVRDIRNTLRWKYNYEVADWSERKLLDHFRTSITEIKESPIDRKILRLSILILAKRNGAVWCHNNIVKNMLQPLVDDANTSESAKSFALSLLGPLLKPYPANMKVHCEIVIDYLMDLLEQKNTTKIQEAIISSLMCVDKNNNNSRLHRFLAGWIPKQVSPDFECSLKNYVRSKRVHTWKNILWTI